MKFNKYFKLSKKIIDEDKFDIKGKSTKLAKGIGKKVATTEGVAGIGAGTAAAMTTTSLGLNGVFLGSFVAVNASTVGISIFWNSGALPTLFKRSTVLPQAESIKMTAIRKILLIVSTNLHCIFINNLAK